MNKQITLSVLKFLLALSPGIQAMGALRGRMTTLAHSATMAQAVKPHTHATNCTLKPLLNSQLMNFNGNRYHRGGKRYHNFPHTQAAFPLVTALFLCGSYDTVKKTFADDEHISHVNESDTPWPDYDALIPEQIKKLLDDHQKDLEADRLIPVKEYDWLIGWMVKHDDNHERIEGAKLFTAALKTLGYSNFIVPQKYTYVSPA